MMIKKLLKWYTVWQAKRILKRIGGYQIDWSKISYAEYEEYIQ